MLTKDQLEQIVYEINQASPFNLKWKGWSSAFQGFSYNQTRNSKYMDMLMKADFIKEKRSYVFCMLADRESKAEGIFLTALRSIGWVRPRIHRFRESIDLGVSL